MASGPMQKCCIVGSMHEGTPTGEIKNIGDTPCYIALPSTPSPHHHAILLMTDVIGMQFRNTQLLADQYATNGYLTIVPDVFAGAEVPFPAPSDFNLQTYIATKMPRVETVDPIYATVIKYMREELGVKRVGGVGYCFGGKYVCRWLKEGALDVGFVAHPSFVEEDEVRGIRGPLSIAAAQTDAIFPAEKRHATEAILSTLSTPWQIFLYSDVEHGFAVKGDLASPKGKFAKEQAFMQAIQWFDEFVKRGSGLKV